MVGTEPSQDSVASLQRYLSNAQSTDVVYRKILDRGEKVGTEHPMVLLRCFQLLKHMSKTVPSTDVMKEIDEFCIKVAGETENKAGTIHASVHKIIPYIRGLVSKNLSLSREGDNGYNILSRSDTNHSFSSESTTTGIASRSASQSANLSHGIAIPSLPGNTSSAAVTLTSDTLNQVEEKESTLAPRSLSSPYTIQNALIERPMPPGFPPRHVSASLVNCIHFGGQFKKSHANSENERGFMVVGIDVSDAIRVSGVDAINRQIEVVKKFKKGAEETHYRTTGQFTVRQRRPRLFQYRNYCNQEELHLATADVEVLVQAMLSHTVQFATRVQASKVLIKVFMDVFAADNGMEDFQIFSFFLEMVASPCAEVRVHAFNFLFNLSLHGHLYSPAQFEGGSSSKILTPREVHIQQYLWKVLCELLLCIYQGRELSPEVWQAALNCWLFFVSEDDEINYEKVKDMDPRLIPAFLEHGGGTNPVVHRKLILLLVNILYGPEKVLHRERFQRMCTCEFLIDQIIQCRSEEGRSNLYVILFDFVGQEVSRRKEPDEAQEWMLAVTFEVLRRFDLPEVLPHLLVFQPEKFVEKLVRFVFFEQLKKDPSLTEISARLNKGLIVEFLYEFERVISHYYALQPEFESRLQHMTTHSTNMTVMAFDDHIHLMKALLSSEDSRDRRQGASWLFSVMKTIMDKSSSLTDVRRDEILQMFRSLANDPRPYIRLTYINIVERLALYIKASIPNFGDEATLGGIFHVLTENFLLLVQGGELNECNLLRMLDVIFRLISLKPVFLNQKTVTHEPDMIYDQFLVGLRIVPYFLLAYIHPAIFQYIFLNIRSNEHASARIVALLLLIQRCSDRTVLDAIGGLTFFKSLLDHHDSAVAFHASRFLLDQLMNEKPDEYRVFLNRLIAHAQQTNNENLLDNPFLQIKFLSSQTAGSRH